MCLFGRFMKCAFDMRPVGSHAVLKPLCWKTGSEIRGCSCKILYYAALHIASVRPVGSLAVLKLLYNNRAVENPEAFPDIHQQYWTGLAQYALMNRFDRLSSSNHHASPIKCVPNLSNPIRIAPTDLRIRSRYVPRRLNNQR